MFFIVDEAVMMMHQRLWYYAKGSGVVSTKKKFSNAYESLSQLQSLLGSNKLRSSALNDDISKYTSDWTKLYSGGSTVVFPTTVEDVSNILKFCNDKKVGCSISREFYSLI